MRTKIGIIGVGRMGSCIVRRLLETGTYKKEDILFTTRHSETADAVSKDLGIKPAKSNADLVKQTDYLIIAVKPQNIVEVLEEVGSLLTKDKTVMSIAASISTSQIESRLSKAVPVLRAMPNTPAFVGEGITAICAGKSVTEHDWKSSESIFAPLGRVVRVDERHLDAVTGLSGCGPAYIYVILESLTDAGIKVGLPRDLATQLAAQTVMGAAKMLLVTGRHPAALKDEVTTPAGCTIDGLMELEEGKLRVTLIKAVVQATKRAKSLAKQAKF
jgi:pyrroline-5-carboxylate reductase